MNPGNLWIGIGFEVGGSLGFGATSAEGVLFNASDLRSLTMGSSKTLRYVEILQTRYSGMFGLSFSATQVPALMMAHINKNIDEIARRSVLSREWQFKISIAALNPSVGHAIAAIGKIDRKFARASGVSYAWATKLAHLFEKLQSRADLMNIMFGIPPSLTVFPIPVSQWTFDLDVGRKVKITNTKVISSGTLTP